VEKRASQLEPRAHSGGEREADAIAQAAEADRVQHLRDPRAQLLPPQTLELAPEFEVLRARKPKEQRPILAGHVADRAPKLGRLERRSYVLSGHPDDKRCRRLVPGPNRNREDAVERPQYRSPCSRRNEGRHHVLVYRHAEQGSRAAEHRSDEEVYAPFV